MKKILLVGGNGTVGKAVQQLLGNKHELTVVSRSSNPAFDMQNPDNMEKFFQESTTFDAVICTAGYTPFQDLNLLKQADFITGIQNKLLGQINLTLIALKYLSAEGSITLTSGITARQPVKQGAVAATTAGGIESFVKTAAAEAVNGIRINAVSPSVLEADLEKYDDFFPGFIPATNKAVAKAFQKSVEGIITGEIIIVGE